MSNLGGKATAFGQLLFQRILWANPSQILTLTPHSGHDVEKKFQSRWIESLTVSLGSSPTRSNCRQDEDEGGWDWPWGGRWKLILLPLTDNYLAFYFNDLRQLILASTYLVIVSVHLLHLCQDEENTIKSIKFAKAWKLVRPKIVFQL